MPKLPVLPAALCLIISPLTAFATPATSAALERCNQQADGMAGLADCQQAELQRQKARLHTTQQALMPALDSARRAQLPALQQQWEAWRQANCRFQVDPQAGTLQPLQAAQCEAAVTRARADELEQMRRGL